MENEIALHHRDRAESSKTLRELLSNFLSEENARQLSDKLLNEFGSLNLICLQTRENLREVSGMTKAIAGLLCAQPIMANCLAKEKILNRRIDIDLAELTHWLRCELVWEDTRYLMAIFMNGHRRILRTHRIFRGTSDRLVIYPREIAKEALAYRAFGVITAENQPVHSEPSLSPVRDRYIQVRDALEVLKVTYHGHFLVDESEVVEVQKLVECAN